MIGSDPESFYNYSAQRWLWNESEQLRRRYIQFDLDALIHIVKEAAGNDAVCLNLSRLPEGNFNKVFLATMQDGKQLVVKIPNRNAGPAHYTTASEVATMQFIQEKLHLPVPKVLAYCSRAGESKLGAEYIVMEKARGIELGRVWDDLKPSDKLAIVKQVAHITCNLAQFRFPHYGALYRRDDIELFESKAIDNEFVVGPTVNRAWFDNGRGEVDVYRGPWTSADDMMEALVHREIACLKKFSTFPRDCQQGIFGGPGCYNPTHKAKLSVLQDFLKIYRSIAPQDKNISAGIIWHNDLHTENIFVDINNPSQITSIIDWQCVPVYPMFLIAHHPSLIEYDGPRVNGFVKPELPKDLDSLDPNAKKSAKATYAAQLFWLSYEIQVQKTVPELLHAFRYKDTLPGQILGIIASTYGDGEPYIQSLLADISQEDVWKQVVGVNTAGDPIVPCPLHYSKEDISNQQMDYEKWQKDIERKARVIDELGVYPGWNGAVPPDQYDEMFRRLITSKQNFLLRESANDEEMALWEKLWPFQDAPLRQDSD
ncbi:kinase-like domain-containing protein [Penicillium verrucosum]|uniref:kinase-like domain-containing protein n=1 Tax=Penicillium verrucosum TaxID=60171 RepID=UPI0025452D33|nr:kinase-like domain-containing protein [Penicillium verrucosum]KAJ5932236.1 kinase-like domain-containing protein [Penicillium verrucosum]